MSFQLTKNSLLIEKEKWNDETSHPGMMEQRREGKNCGIPSYCTANPLALEIILKRAKLLHTPVLIEATANQVNQYGGYTGMLPKDFYDMIQKWLMKSVFQKS